MPNWISRNALVGVWCQGVWAWVVVVSAMVSASVVRLVSRGMFGIVVGCFVLWCVVGVFCPPFVAGGLLGGGSVGSVVDDVIGFWGGVGGLFGGRLHEHLQGVVERFLRLQAEAVEGVERLGVLFAGAVFLGVLGGVLDHAFDVGVGEGGGVLDGDVGALAGGFLFGADVEDAVGVDVVGDFDLRHAGGHGGDAVEFEAAERLVVGGHRAFALQDVDFDAGLVVVGGGERFGFADGDGGVAVDQFGEDPAFGFDAEREGGDVEEDDVVAVDGLAPLNGSSHPVHADNKRKTGGRSPRSTTVIDGTSNLCFHNRNPWITSSVFASYQILMIHEKLCNIVCLPPPTPKNAC